MVMELSKSRVLMYIECPLKFSYRYVNGIPEEPNKYMQIGIDFHSFAEKFFKIINIETFEYPPIEGYNEEVMVYIKNFLEMEKERWQIMKDKKHYKPILLEATVHAKGLKGIVDRVDYNPELGYVLLDYKTGALRKFDYYMFELCLYAYMVEQTHKIEINHVGLVGVKDKKTKIQQITKEDKQRAVEIANRVAKLIEIEEFEPRIGGSGCFFCYCIYKKLCEVKRGINYEN